MSASRNVGTDNCNAKLNEDKVRTIRAFYRQGMSVKELAKEFGVTAANIWYVTRHVTWKHVR